MRLKSGRSVERERGPDVLGDSPSGPSSTIRRGRPIVARAFVSVTRQPRQSRRSSRRESAISVRPIAGRPVSRQHPEAHSVAFFEPEGGSSLEHVLTRRRRGRGSRPPGRIEAPSRDAGLTSGMPLPLGGLRTDSAVICAPTSGTRRTCPRITRAARAASGAADPASRAPAGPEHPSRHEWRRRWPEASG